MFNRENFGGVFLQTGFFCVQRNLFAIFVAAAVIFIVIHFPHFLSSFRPLHYLML